jgi:hypothetical protein
MFKLIKMPQNYQNRVKTWKCKFLTILGPPAGRIKIHIFGDFFLIRATPFIFNQMHTSAYLGYDHFGMVRWHSVHYVLLVCFPVTGTMGRYAQIPLVDRLLSSAAENGSDQGTYISIKFRGPAWNLY